MATTIISRQNQSMMNVIIQAVGSLEGGVQFCVDNNVASTDVPAPGTVYVVSDAAIAAAGAKGAAVLRYLSDKSRVAGKVIVVANLASASPDVFVDDDDVPFEPTI